MVNAPTEKTFFSFLEEGKILKGREGNRPTSVCPLYYLSFVFCFLSYLFLFFLLSYFLSILFFLSCSSPVFSTPVLGTVEALL